MYGDRFIYELIVPIDDKCGSRNRLFRSESSINFSLICNIVLCNSGIIIISAHIQNLCQMLRMVTVICTCILVGIIVCKVILSHPCIGYQKVIVVCHLGADRVIPGDIYLIPDAVNAYKIPCVILGTAARSVVGGAGDDFSLYSRITAQKGKSVCVALTYCGAVKRALRGINGSVIKIKRVCDMVY